MAFATNTAIEDDVWVNPLAYYMLDGRNVNFGLIGNLVDIVPGPQIDFEALAVQTTDSRIDTMLDGHDNVWLMHDPTIAIYDELSIFTDSLSNRGYVNCGNIVQQPELLGSVWTQSPDQCQQIVSTCAVPPADQP